MASWRYHIQRARSNVWLDRDAQLLDVNLTWALSGPGDLTSILDARVAKQFGIDDRFVYDEWSSYIFAEKDNVLQWGGIIDQSEDIGNGRRSIHARSFSGYAKGVKYTSDLTRYYAIDAFDLIRLLYDTMQADPMQDIGMILSSNLAGQIVGSEDPGDAPVRAPGESDEDFEARMTEYATRINEPYELAWYNTPDFGEEVDKIMAQIDGDYVERHEWNGLRDEVFHYLDLSWPTAGARRTDLRFVEGENVSTPPAPGNEADEFGNHVIALGAGEERHMLREEAQIDDGKLKRHIIAPAKDLYSPSALQSLARATLFVAQNTTQYDTLEVYEHPNAPLGSWSLGDEIKLQTYSGYFQLDEWVKVVGWSMSPASPDVAQLTVVRIPN